jgi:hypothetical protein
MIVYHYDPDTGAYLNWSSEADEDQLQPGNFLIPAYATPIVPPSPGNPKTQHAVFTAGAWHVEDKPIPPSITTNVEQAPVGMFHNISIKEALKGGVT